MKLLTKEIEKKFLANPLYIHDAKPAHLVDVIVKYFSPVGVSCWYIVEASQEPNGDWMMFGFCMVSQGCGELGYVLLSQLKEIKLMKGALGIERDISFSGTLEDAKQSHPRY